MLREEVLSKEAQITNVLDGDQKAITRPNVSRVRFRRVLPLLLACQDAVLIYGSFALAYWTRYSLKAGPHISSVVAYSTYQGVALMLLSIMMPTLIVKGAYRSRLSTEIADEVLTIFSSATITVASVLVVTFMLHHFEYSRAVIVYMWIFLILFLALGRAFTRGLQGIAHRRGWGVRRLLVVGASDTGKMIMQSVKNRPDLGYEVVGFVDRRSHTRVPTFGRFSRLGIVKDIPMLIETLRVDDVIVALPSSAHEDVCAVVDLCEGRGVGLRLVPDLFRVTPSRVDVDDIAGIPLLDVREKPLQQRARALKRAMDIVVGAMAILVSLPIVAVLALLIKLDSEGPAFIRQERVGKGGCRFTCFKLRSMRTDAADLLPALQDQNETAGPIFKMRRDPRCTRVGRVLRRYSLDELPQLWNVLRGDMSLVGPRPPLQQEVDRYAAWQLRRLETKPGLTGLWQISGRSNLVFDEMVMMDIMYVDNWSLALDLKILFRTFTAVLAARGAY